MLHTKGQLSKNVEVYCKKYSSYIGACRDDAVPDIGNSKIPDYALLFGLQAWEVCSSGLNIHSLFLRPLKRV
jgi:hypothetical protein